MTPLQKYAHAISVAKKQPKGMVLSAANVLADVSEYAAQLESSLAETREENEKIKSWAIQAATLLNDLLSEIETGEDHV